MTEFLQGVIDSSLLQMQELLASVIAFLPRLIAGLVVLLIGLLITRRVRDWAQRLVIRRNISPVAAAALVNASYTTALLLSFTVALYAVGANIFGLVAGLGISGLVIGFALKDIIENFLAGALVLIRRPFVLGDMIETEGFTGRVLGIELQQTTMQTIDNLHVLIPNSAIYKQCIINYSTFPVRRREVNLEISYEDDLRGAVEGLLDAVRSVEGVAHDPAPRLELKDFTDSSVKSTLYYFINTREYDFAMTHNAVLIELHDAIARLNLALPYPTHTVILSRTDGAA